MAKTSGGTRVIRPTSGSREYNRGVFGYQSGMQDVVTAECYFSEKSGGYLLAMEGHNLDEAERTAFRHLADSGYIVVAIPEGGKTYISGFNRDGEATFADGFLMGNVFELKSPDPQNRSQDGLNNSVKKALNHARAKSAQVPVIFDRHGIYHRENIEAGLKDYESKTDVRFKAILVIDRYGNVYEHIHNK